MYLLEWWNPWTNTEGQGANIINALSALVTFFTFLYLILKDRKKSIQLNDLAEISGKLASLAVETANQTKIMNDQLKLFSLQTRLMIAPRWTLPTVTYQNMNRKFKIKMGNFGHPVRIIDVAEVDDFIRVHISNLPIDVEPRTHFSIEGEYTDAVPFNETPPFCVSLSYLDGGNNIQLGRFHVSGNTVAFFDDSLSNHNKPSTN